MSAEFCDTNILVYAYDPSAGQKHILAEQLLERLWNQGSGTVSVRNVIEIEKRTRKTGRWPAGS